MKVSYTNMDGLFTSTAYLNMLLPDGSYIGTNKHTDEPVRVRWSGKQWDAVPFNAEELLINAWREGKESEHTPACRLGDTDCSCPNPYKEALDA